MKKFVISATNLYTKSMIRRPMLTNVLTSSILMAGGDIFAQKVLEKGQEAFDYERFFRMSLVGAFLVGPYNKIWFLNVHPHLLEKVLPRLAPSLFKHTSKVTFVATSVVAETFIMAWPFNTSFIFANNLVKTKGSLNQSIQAVKTDLMDTMKAGWKIYPVSQIGIYLIPKHFRAVADSLVDLVWSTVISNLQHKQNMLKENVLVKEQSLQVEEQNCQQRKQFKKQLLEKIQQISGQPVDEEKSLLQNKNTQITMLSLLTVSLLYNKNILKLIH